MQHIKEIQNGPKAAPTFSDSEMTRRLTRLRQVMAEQRLDAVIFTSYHCINYYSDFLYCSFGRPYALVVTPDKATTVSANIDGGQPYRRSFADNLVYTDWRRDNYFRALQQLAPARGRIGIEEDHLPVERLRKLQAALPEAVLADISGPVMAQRMVKSPEEIDLIRNGARIADIGGAACRAAIAEGVPEHEIALASTGAMVRAIAETYPQAELMDT
jgi:creatinase